MKDNQDLFLELFELQKERLWWFCLSVSKNYEDAKELLAETIYQSCLNFEKVKNHKAFLSYLFTIANRINNRKKTRLDYLMPEELENMIGNSESPESILEYKELYLALDKLPSVQKEAIILFDLMGFSRTEICEIQNTNIANVKARLYRGRKKLAEILGLIFRDDIVNGKKVVSIIRGML